MEKDKKKKLDLEKLQKKLRECEKAKEEFLAGWQRSRADFLNYKKGELKRVGELVKYTNAALLLKILPIIDNFELTGEKLPENLKNNENIKGFFQIKTQLLDLLKNHGVEAIVALGKNFDPNFHEVVEEVETKGKGPGIVITEVQKGYKIHGKLLRPAKVRITK